MENVNSIGFKYANSIEAKAGIKAPDAFDTSESETREEKMELTLSEHSSQSQPTESNSITNEASNSNRMTDGSFVVGVASKTVTGTGTRQRAALTNSLGPPGFAVPPRTSSRVVENTTNVGTDRSTVESNEDTNNGRLVLKTISTTALVLLLLLHLSTLISPRACPLPSSFLPKINNNSFCDIHSLPTPLRVISIPFLNRTGYKLALHAPGRDVYLSDPLWAFYSSPLSSRTEKDPHTDLHSRFLKASERAKDRYGSTSSVPVIDVGAHIGIHSAFLAQLGFSVKAFEPHWDSWRLLECNSRWAKQGRVEVMNEAVGPVGVLETGFVENVGHSVLRRKPKGRGEMMEVRNVELGNVLTSLRERAWILKVATEGTEASILAPFLFSTTSHRNSGLLPRYIWASLPREKDDWDNGPAELLQALFGAGYRCWLARVGETNHGKTRDSSSTKEEKREQMRLERHGVLGGDEEVRVGKRDLEELAKGGGGVWCVENGAWEG